MKPDLNRNVAVVSLRLWEAVLLMQALSIAELHTSPRQKIKYEKLRAAIETMLTNEEKSEFLALAQQVNAGVLLPKRKSPA